MKSRTFKFWLKPILIFLLTVVVAAPVAAQQGGGSGLSISPLHTQLTLEPGKAHKIEITIKNVTSGPITAKPFVNDFQSDNVTGNPVVITDLDKKLPTSIRDFVAGLENVQLAVGEQKKVTVTILPPKNIPPGAYYGVIRYQAIPVSSPGAPEEGQVSLSASVGTIVLVQIEGDLVEKMQLLSLRVYDGDRGGSFFFQKPNQAGVELKNLGNAFAQPFGRVVLQDMSGKEVYSYELNNVNPRSTVLPGSQRTFKDTIKGIDKPGRYTLSASVAYGQGSDVLVAQKTFWYVPVWILAIVILVLLALILATYFAYRRFRFSRRRLKRHQR